MILPFAILVMSLWTVAAVQTQSTNDEIRLRAAVQSVVPLSDFSGTLIPVGPDPRFALTVRIESAAPKSSNFTTGTVVTPGIHSPSLLFGGEEPKGKTYDFVLHKRTEHGKVRFFWLEAREAQAR